MSARLTRLRRTPALRALVRETRLAPADLVQPLFVVEDAGAGGAVASLPGGSRLTLAEVGPAAEAAGEAGVRAVLLFGVPARKDARGASAYDAEGVVPRAVRAVRERAPGVAVITDVCLCQYTDHGHCAALGADGRADAGATLEANARAAVAHARAGADVVAPSGMHDGLVAAVRAGLDGEGLIDAAVLSYAVKYASAFYGPFREAASSAPAWGDRRSHQMDIGNAREALAEASRDLEEGADAVMVKPAGPSLDVLAGLRRDLPWAVLAAYQVSGEYAAIMAAAANGWLDERAALWESLTAIKRAGAGLIVTYAATRAARWAQEVGA